MTKKLLLIIAILLSFTYSYSQTVTNAPSQQRGTYRILGGEKVDSMFWLPVRALITWPYNSSAPTQIPNIPYIGGIQVNPADTLPYYMKAPGIYYRFLTTNDPVGSGTVTSVGVVSGAGISIGGTSPITTAGTFTVTNTAPDQVVSITAGTGISVLGPYPTFTVTNTSPSFGGTVTSVSVVPANGFAGIVANPTTTPAITLTTTVNANVIKGNGVALIPAIPGTDYQVPGSYITALTGDGTASGPGSTVFTLSTVNATPGTFGSATAIPIITVDAKGRATIITTVAVSAGTGTVTSVNVISANGFAGTVATPTTTPSITLTTTVNANVIKGNGTALIPAVAGTDYQAPGNYITSLTGDGTASGPGSVALTLSTVNATPGTYGSATVVPITTVNNKGLVTSITTVAITAGTGTVTTVSVISANGFSGTVANPTTTPAITLTTTVNAPAVAGNGTALIPATTTGTGSTIVLSTSPVLVTPTLGVAVATSVNGLVIIAVTADTLAIAAGKKLTVSNTFTLTATDGSTLSIGTGGTLNTAAYVADATLVHTTGAENVAGVKTFTGGVQVTAPSNTYGNSTGNSANSLGNGATTSGNTKTNLIGTGGLAGSITNITIGANAGTSTTTMQGSTVINSLTKLNLATGTNTATGTATLSGGTVTVNTTSVTAASIIMLTGQNCVNCAHVYKGTVTAGTSFVINSTSALDGSSIGYTIIN